MKMKKKSIVVMVLCFVLTGVLLTGCGEKQPEQETQLDTPAGITQEAEETVDEQTAEETVEEPETEAVEETAEETTEQTAEETAQTAAGYEDNFAVDSKAAKEFAQKVKDAVANKDLETLAELTAFPVYVGLPDVDVVETKEDFLALGADAVFTEELLKSIEMADIENLQPSMAGFSISGEGNANVNFGVADGVLAINGINY